ncbi:MAG: hypothetical protein KKD63_02310 [Proteobacteria bacterium]|nr:hypothetical protein [Desulfobulbaceae bacterium]MBU4151695.1 hypothetical protein [Pseudomonadota bacterium]
MKKTPRSIPTKRHFPTLTILAIIVGAIILLLLKNSYFDNKKTIVNTPEQTSTTTTSLPPVLPQSLASDLPNPPLAEPLPPSPEIEITPKITVCQDASATLQTLFKHLEQQQYIKAYVENEPVDAELYRIIAKILNTPPTNSNETADLLSVIRNSSHLFRVLGRKDLSFLKDIITNEHPSIEQHFASLYAWSTMDKTCRDSSAIKLEFPLTKTYEYAAFFLNTLGGQSYLSRRDSTIRTLTKYYCVLIVDQAASQSINTYNINLAYHLDSVINDLKNSTFLENQNTYLTTLEHIKKTLYSKRKL